MRRRGTSKDRTWLYLSVAFNAVLCLLFVASRAPSLPDGAVRVPRRFSTVTEVGTAAVTTFTMPMPWGTDGGLRVASADPDEEKVRATAEAIRKSSAALDAARRGWDPEPTAAGVEGRSGRDEVEAFGEEGLERRKQPVGFSALAGAIDAANGVGRGLGVGSGRGAAARKREGSNLGGGEVSPIWTGVGEPWLTVGIPTAPRNRDVDYLTETLETLLAELPTDSSHALYGKILVIVMNTKPDRHEVFDRVRRRFEGKGDDERGRPQAIYSTRERKLMATAKVHLRFVDNPGTYTDPTPHKPDPDDLHNPENIPGHAVRQQTADLATLIDLAVSNKMFKTAPYFMFMEDDFKVCQDMIKATSYLVKKADAVYPHWLGVRFSYGMNGVVMRSDDLNPFAEYLAEHVSRQPPDILWREWVEGRRPDVRAHTAGRRMIVYRYNLMEHIGKVSTFAVRPNRPEWPGCHDEMTKVWSLSAWEKFDNTCSAYDVSPCDAKAGVDVKRWRDEPLSFAWANLALR